MLPWYPIRLLAAKLGFWSQARRYTPREVCGFTLYAPGYVGDILLAAADLLVEYSPAALARVQTEIRSIVASDIETDFQMDIRAMYVNVDDGYRTPFFMGFALLLEASIAHSVWRRERRSSRRLTTSAVRLAFRSAQAFAAWWAIEAGLGGSDAQALMRWTQDLAQNAERRVASPVESKLHILRRIWRELRRVD